MSERPEQPQLDANRRNWDARATVHAASQFYDIERYVRDHSLVSEVVQHDLPALGNVAGRTMLHLQCHIGTDTISWTRLGVHAMGLDFSDEALAIARDLSARSGTTVEFVQGNVLDASEIVSRRFDIVYASIGVLCWIPSVADWARAAAGCLEPGGTLYLRDGHPFNSTFEWGRSDDKLVCVGPYFERAGQSRSDEPWTYTDGPQLAVGENYQWAHGLGEVIGAFIDAGLVIRAVDEQDTIPWQAFEWMVRADNGEYRMPPGRHDMPLTFSVTATREGRR